LFLFLDGPKTLSEFFETSPNANFFMDEVSVDDSEIGIDFLSNI